MPVSVSARPARPVRPVRRPVRLTRRGRVVAFVGAVLLAASLVFLFVATFAVPAAGSAGDAAAGLAGGAEPAVSTGAGAPSGALGAGDRAGRSGAGGGWPVAVVLPGDTLWSVAARHVPSRDAHGAIEEIRRLNGLRGHTIHPGQELRLPRR